MTTKTDQVPGDLSATGLVARARTGDHYAWDGLVERYAPLIWSICRRYRLSSADTHEVGQNVWLQLLDSLGRIDDPVLPGWLATTTRRECSRVASAAHPPRAVAERQAAVLGAFLHLPPGDQQLMTLLVQDPPLAYAEIGIRLGIPADSIGPRRRRCLERLRRALIEP